MTPLGALWHVTLRAAGDPASSSTLDRALRHLCALDPGNMAARYGQTRTEVQYWDEGDDIGSVTAAALAWWNGTRASAGLPDWPLVAIEVHDRLRWRERQAAVRVAMAPGSVAPLA